MIAYFVLPLVTAVVSLFVFRYSDMVVLTLFHTVVERPPSPRFGLSVALATTVVIFLYMVLSQFRNSYDHRKVRNYRMAEEKLVELGELKTEQLITYHSNYSWHAYAGFSFGTLFIIVSLLFTEQAELVQRFPVHHVTIFVALALLAVSSVILAGVDMVHTNTLSPLVPPERRFAIITSVIMAGGLAIALQVCAIGVFLSLINSWLSIISSLAAMLLSIHFTRRRGLAISAIQKEFSLSDEKAVAVLMSDRRRHDTALQPAPQARGSSAPRQPRSEPSLQPPAFRPPPPGPRQEGPA